MRCNCAKTISEIRSSLNLSREQLAIKLGLSKSAISNYELGLRLMPVKIAKRLITVAKQQDIEIDLDYIYREL